MKYYLVGGTVRNHLIGAPASKDIDIAVEADSYEEMMRDLERRGAVIYLARPEFVTARSKVSRFRFGTFHDILPEFDMEHPAINVDFTLCREERQYHDNRHPSSVTPTTIEKDLMRRDFTINAVAVSEDGRFIDPTDGIYDAYHRKLKCVGEPSERFEEDPLRMLRAIRFAVKYSLGVDYALGFSLDTHALAELLGTLPVERVRQELHAAFAADWLATSRWLIQWAPRIGYQIQKHFPELWLKPTTEGTPN